jgi:hypothetical protein
VSILPYQVDDVVQWDGQLGIVEEVRGDRVVVRTDDEMVHITTQELLRDHQRPRRGRHENLCAGRRGAAALHGGQAVVGEDHPGADRSAASRRLRDVDLDEGAGAGQAGGRQAAVLRAHVFRDTYGKLEDTTLKTWLAWFPEDEFGRFYWSKPMLHEIRVGDIELDVHFVALEDERAIDYFKSLETTVEWWNEVQFMERALFDEGVTRVGRYPRMIDGGPVRPQVIADMNAPDETHWVPIMRKDVAVPDWFTEDQRGRTSSRRAGNSTCSRPGCSREGRRRRGDRAMSPNPNAENLKYLPRLLPERDPGQDEVVDRRERAQPGVAAARRQAGAEGFQPRGACRARRSSRSRAADHHRLRLRPAAVRDLRAVPARAVVDPARTDRARHGRQEVRAAAAQRTGAEIPRRAVRDLGRPVGRLQGPERRSGAVPDFPRQQAADPRGAVVPVLGAAAGDGGGVHPDDRGQAGYHASRRPAPR